MFNNNLIYFNKYSLGLHEYQGMILLFLNGCAFAAIPIWAYLAVKLGKRNTWLISMTFLFFGFTVFYFYPISKLNELLFIVSIIGFSNGATGVLFWSMLPDTIEYGEWKTGIRTESSLYGFMTFAQKGAIALAAFILGIILTKIGFEPNQEQSKETLENLKALMSLVPIVGVLISFALVYFYPIDKKYHNQLMDDIEKRKLKNV